MNRLFRATALAILLVAGAPSWATDFPLTVGPGTSSTDFGNTRNGPGEIDDSFFFTVPAGSANGFVGSIALTTQLDVDFTAVLLDDKAFDLILSDGTELRTLSPTLLADGPHVIRVRGTWGEEGGSYAGTLNFSPAGAPVPEPTTWALMIAGFGAVGWALRDGARRSVALA